MIGHLVPAAFPAILTLVEFSLLERRDVLRSRCEIRTASGFQRLKAFTARQTTSDKNCNDNSPSLPVPPTLPVLLRRKSSFQSEALASSLEFVRHRSKAIH
jgi:hypothetical protein